MWGSAFPGELECIDTEHQLHFQRFAAPIANMIHSRSSPKWRDGRVAEGARLESVFRGNSNVGSNPTLSAIFLPIFRPDGEIGRRSGLKIRRPKGRGGSSPPPGTK